MPLAVTVYEAHNGPMRVAIEAQRAGLTMFSRSDQNTIIRTAMREAALYWIRAFLPKRFDNYAQTVLGYRVSDRWRKKKTKLAGTGAIPGPQPTPLVYTGIMRSRATNDAKADGRSTATKAVAIITIPYGHPVLPSVTAVMKTIPKHEIDRMATVVHKTLVQLMDAGVATYREKGPQRTLTGAVSVRNPGVFNQRQVA